MTVRTYLDGAPVSAADFTISGFDDGLLLGLTVFETLRTYNRCLFRPERHIERLLHSVEVVGVPCPDGPQLLDELRQAVAGTTTDVRLRLTLTMGGRRLLSVAPMDPHAVCAPVRAATLLWEPTAWLDGRAKHGSRAVTEVARRRAGVDEVIWVGRDGSLTEGGRSSVFAVLDGVMITPPDDGRILPGITRQALLDAGRAALVPVAEAPLPADAAFTELYASSTLKELAPIVELNARPAPGGGPVGERLVRAFHELVARECPGRVSAS